MNEVRTVKLHIDYWNIIIELLEKCMDDEIIMITGEIKHQVQEE